MFQISHLDPLKLPVRQKGWVKEAVGVKYFSTVARCFSGGDWQRSWMTLGISLTDRCLDQQLASEYDRGALPGFSITNV